MKVNILTSEFHIFQKTVYILWSIHLLMIMQKYLKINQTKQRIWLKYFRSLSSEVSTSALLCAIQTVHWCVESTNSKIPRRLWNRSLSLYRIYQMHSRFSICCWSAWVLNISFWDIVAEEELRIFRNWSQKRKFKFINKRNHFKAWSWFCYLKSQDLIQSFELHS